jgi:L-arabinose isomerase
VRFGDNMRFVAVTEGDKVEAELKFGYSVNTHGIGDLVKVIGEVRMGSLKKLVAEYQDSYNVSQRC